MMHHDCSSISTVIQLQTPAVGMFDTGAGKEI